MRTEAGTRILVVGEPPRNLPGLDDTIRGGGGPEVRRIPAGEEAVALLLERGFPLAILDEAGQRALAAALKSARAELQHALQARDEFMAMVVHELRTPLSVLGMETRVRQHHFANGNAAFFTGDNLAKMLERDQRQVRSLTRLIDDMLDATRLQEGRLALRRGPCELASLLRRVVGEVAEQHPEAAIELDAGAAAIPGEWDEFRLEQIVVNLLTNALRHADGRPVAVRLERLPGHARIGVHDQGSGIAAEDQARVFDRFARVGDGKRAGGLGLGLYIARRLVEAHGGTIAVASAPDEGTTFTVTLPLAA
jgi:signal transduction histidine kinase